MVSGLTFSADQCAVNLREIRGKISKIGQMRIFKRLCETIGCNIQEKVAYFANSIGRHICVKADVGPNIGVLFRPITWAPRLSVPIGLYCSTKCLSNWTVQIDKRMCNILAKSFVRHDCRTANVSAKGMCYEYGAIGSFCSTKGDVMFW